MTPYSAPMLGNYLGGPPSQLAPFGFGASLLGNGDFMFRMLTTCSWEQSDTMVKVYVPLRGVQTELLRSHFTMTSVEARPLGGNQTGFERGGEACERVRAAVKRGPCRLCGRRCRLSRPLVQACPCGVIRHFLAAIHCVLR